MVNSVGRDLLRHLSVRGVTEYISARRIKPGEFLEPAGQTERSRKKGAGGRGDNECDGLAELHRSCVERREPSRRKANTAALIGASCHVMADGPDGSLLNERRMEACVEFAGKHLADCEKPTLWSEETRIQLLGLIKHQIWWKPVTHHLLTSPNSLPF